MLARNNTPFAALAFEQVHRDGEPMGVIVARATYKLTAAGELTLAPEQKLVLADEYEGDPHETPLFRVGDLIPFKPRADITLLGNMQPLGGRRSNAWRSGIKVGEHGYLVRCNGYRYWEPQQQKADSSRLWKLGDGTPIDFVPMDYRYAAGGDVIGDPARGISPFNPRGFGILHPKHTPADLRPAAPMLDSDDDPIIDPFAEMEPQGTAPIPPFWRFRQQYAGTYNADWKAQRHPQLPKDFDYRFYQTAHPKLIYPGYLRGDEFVQIVNMTTGGGRLTFNLPAIQPYACFDWIDERQVMGRLNLDGLHLDLRGNPPWRVDLTWRAWIVICPQFHKIDLFFCGLSEPALVGMPRAAEEGLVDGDEAGAPVGVLP